MTITKNCKERRSASKHNLKLALALATSLLAGTAAAEEQGPRYTMTVISNQSYSGKVLKGDYESAIDRITASRVGKRKRFASLTNLCVAYTKVGELELAEETCNAAVVFVEERQSGRPRTVYSPGDIEAADRADLAVALSNRGVCRAARGETELAHADFEASLELGADLSAPEINLARLDSATRKLY